MRYRDAGAAIEWLIKVFGFEKKVAYTAENGDVMHAELTYGNGMIMLGTSRNDDLDRTRARGDDLGQGVDRCLLRLVGGVDLVRQRLEVGLRKLPCGAVDHLRAIE